MLKTARKILFHLRQAAKADKAKQLETMAEAIAKLEEYPEWPFKERFLSLQIEAALKNMLKVDTQAEFNLHAGERNGLLKAMNASKLVQKERAFLKQLGDEEGGEDTSRLHLLK